MKKSSFIAGLIVTLCLGACSRDTLSVSRPANTSQAPTANTTTPAGKSAADQAIAAEAPAAQPAVDPKVEKDQADASKANAGCPPEAPLTDQNCSIHYLGIGLLSALTLHVEDLITGDLLDEALNGSDDPACTPLLKKMTNQVHGHWYKKVCPKADMRDVRQIINEGNQSKDFCKKVGEGIDFDLFNRKRIQAYIVAKLRETNPELCK